MQEYCQITVSSTCKNYHHQKLNKNLCKFLKNTHPRFNLLMTVLISKWKIKIRRLSMVKTSCNCSRLWNYSKLNGLPGNRSNSIHLKRTKLYGSSRRQNWAFIQLGTFCKVMNSHWFVQWPHTPSFYWPYIFKRIKYYTNIKLVGTYLCWNHISTTSGRKPCKITTLLNYYFLIYRQ